MQLGKLTGPTQPGRLDQLTSARFFAAFTVICNHFLPVQNLPEAAPLVNLIGDAAVSFFFMLSGFVLTISNRTSDGALIGTRRDFYIRRIIRIYPQYFMSFMICAPFVVVITLQRHPEPLSALLRLAGNGGVYIAMVQSWIPPLANAWNGPGWSLSTEVFFYAIFPFLPVPASRSMRFVWPACIGALVLPALASQFLTTSPVAWRFWYFFPPLRLAEFVLGCGVASIWIAKTHSTLFAKWGSPIVSGCLLAICASAYSGIDAAFRFTTSATLPLLLLALASGKGAAVRALSWRPLVVLGQASYGLYLIQVPVMWAYRYITVGNLNGRPDALIDFAAYAVSAIVISVALFYFWEQPITSFAGQIRKSRSAAKTRSPGVHIAKPNPHILE